jgi:hypothetical protein
MVVYTSPGDVLAGKELTRMSLSCEEILADFLLSIAPWSELQGWAWWHSSSLCAMAVAWMLFSSISVNRLFCAPR